MPHLTYEITIVAEHQPHLEVLGIRANIGDVMTWADIKSAYKKHALITHPDRSDSNDAFHTLNNAFKDLEHLLDQPTDRYDPFGGFAHMDKLDEEREYILNELRASGTAIPNKIIININGCETTCYINLEKALEEERKVRLDEEYKMKILTLGYFAFSLGAGIVGGICINLLAGKDQINSSQNRIASLCGTGLIVGGGLLIMNGFFERQKKSNANNKPQNSKQETEQELLINRGFHEYGSTIISD